MATGLLESLLSRLPVVLADSAPLTAVGVDLAPLPGRVPPVRMAREDVTVHVFPAFVAVEASFELEHRGDAPLDLEVGFPALTAPGFAPRSAALCDFHAEVDGAPLPSTTRTVENPHFPFWHTWTQRFEPGTTTRLVVRYWAPLFCYRGISRAPFVYVLRTGRFWDGPIGEAIVTVRASGGVTLDAIEALPAGAVTDAAAGTLTWRFTDLVPEEDVRLLVSPAAIAGARLGRPLRDPARLAAERPPAGARVEVVGYLRDENEEVPRLLGERSRDTNIAIPDGFDVHFEEEETDVVGVALQGLRGAPRGRVIVDGAPSGWARVVVTGSVAYEGERMIVTVERVEDVVPGEPAPCKDPSLPWVTSKERKAWSPHGPKGRDQWPRFVGKDALGGTTDPEPPRPAPAAAPTRLPPPVPVEEPWLRPWMILAAIAALLFVYGVLTSKP